MFENHLWYLTKMPITVLCGKKWNHISSLSIQDFVTLLCNNVKTILQSPKKCLSELNGGLHFDKTGTKLGSRMTVFKFNQYFLIYNGVNQTGQL